MYTDLLIRIKNAQQARKDSVRAPFSNMDFAIAQLLEQRGFIASAAKKGRSPKRTIEVGLRYADGQGAITGVRLVSKPSRRWYSGYRELAGVRGAGGMSVLSTPQGILTSSDARKKKVGGEVLFEIW